MRRVRPLYVRVSEGARCAGWRGASRLALTGTAAHLPRLPRPDSPQQWPSSNQCSTGLQQLQTHTGPFEGGAARAHSVGAARRSSPGAGGLGLGHQLRGAQSLPGVTTPLCPPPRSQMPQMICLVPEGPGMDLPFNSCGPHSLIPHMGQTGSYTLSSYFC